MNTQPYAMIMVSYLLLFMYVWILLIQCSLFCSGNTVLVTGGTGYIGSHTVLALQQSGYNVIIVDNLSNSKPSVIKRIKKISGKEPLFSMIDCTNYTELETVFKEHRIDAVIHMAGYKAVLESHLKPLLYYENNLISTINVLHLMKSYGVSKLLFSSSATVYGNATQLTGFTEDCQTGQGITNPYGRTKYMIEEILKDVSLINPNISVTILRYFNPIGAHPSGLLGENPNGIPNNLMPVVTRVYRERGQKLQIYGNDYPTPDGTCIRDYIHVMDLAEGHVAALNHSRAGLSVYNIGTGSGTSVSSLVSQFERITGSILPKEYCPRRPGDLPNVFANPGRAIRELGWHPHRTVIDAIIDTVRYLSQADEL